MAKREIDEKIVLHSRVLDTNARYFGVDMSSVLDTTGESIARSLLSHYPSSNYSFLIGLAGNAADGLNTAIHLIAKSNSLVTVYLVGRQGEFISPYANALWERLKSIQQRNTNLILKQDSYHADIDNNGVIIEAISGTGLVGNLKKRQADIIKKCSHFKSKIVAIDIPVHGYTPHLCLAIGYAKYPKSEIIAVSLPPEVGTYVGPGEVKALYTPKKFSYKTQNGNLLIIGGTTSSRNDIATAALSAAKYTGNISVYNMTRSSSFLQETEIDLTDFAEVSDSGLENAIKSSDAILIGPGWEENLVNLALLNQILYQFPEKNYVFTSSTLGMLDLDLVRTSGNVIFTLKRSELDKLLGNRQEKGGALEGQIRRFSVENNCLINLEGTSSTLMGKNPFSDKFEVKFNSNGNARMLDDQSGAILAGITSSIATKNNPWLAMCAGSFLTGLAGNMALQKVGTMFSTTDVIDQLQLALRWCDEF